LTFDRNAGPFSSCTTGSPPGENVAKNSSNSRAIIGDVSGRARCGPYAAPT
jgi:hypothetical protein